MWSRYVVILNPGGDLYLRIGLTDEDGLVQQLFAHVTYEALDLAILHRLIPKDVIPIEADRVAPSE